MGIPKIYILNLLISGLLLLSSLGCERLPDWNHKPFYAGDMDGVQAYLSDTFETSIKNRDFSGLSIAIFNDQGIIWSQGFGYANKEASIKASADTTYRAGQLGVLFLAASVFKAQSLGYLDINRPIIEYLPELRLRSGVVPRSITIHSLLSQHSGLPKDIWNGAWYTDSVNRLELSTLLSNEYLVCTPNTEYIPSNISFVLIQAIIERLTQQPYTQFVSQHFFQPLSLSNTHYSQSFTDNTVAKPYIKQKPQAFIKARDIGFIGLNSSVLDIATFGVALLNQGSYKNTSVLGPSQMSQLLSPQNKNLPLNFDLDVGYMLHFIDGMFDPSLHGVRNGRTIHQRSIFRISKDYKLGVVLMSNDSKSSRYLHEMSGRALQLAINVTDSAIPRLTKQSVDDDVFTALYQKPLSNSPTTPLLTSDLGGSYSSAIGLFNMQETAVDNLTELSASLFGQKIVLTPNPDTKRFSVKIYLFGFIPFSNKLLNQIAVTFQTIEDRLWVFLEFGSRRFRLLEKISPVSIPNSWKDALGRYKILNPDPNFQPIDSLVLKEKDGFLILETTIESFQESFNFGSLKLVLWPLNDTDALLRGTIINGTVLLDRQEDAIYLTYSGFRMKKY